VNTFLPGSEVAEVSEHFLTWQVAEVGEHFFTWQIVEVGEHFLTWQVAEVGEILSHLAGCRSW
jgi:hypothetical protein